MKSKILLLVTACVLCIGCSRDERDLFDQSANERLNSTLEKDQNAFVGAVNGWEMLYFPNKESGGYNVLVKFDPNSRAIFATSNELTTNDRYVLDDNSTWVVKADYGPLLSFDTYNKVFHAWADPQDDGDGYLGDYEFLILKADANMARLKGKKHEAYSLMIPLAEGQNWTEYFEQVRAYRDLIFTGNNGMYMTIIDNQDSLKYMYQDGILQDPDSLGSLYFPLVVRPGCVQLYDNGYKGAVHFVLNEDLSALVCTDAGHEHVHIIPGFTPTEYFLFRFGQKEAHWIYEEDGTSADVANAINAICKDAAAKGATITRIALDQMTPTTMGKEMTTLRISYLAEGKLFEGYIKMNLLQEENLFTLIAGQADASLTPLLLRIAPNVNAGTKRFTDIFCDSYTVTSHSGSMFNMTHMDLNSTTKTGKKIHIIADKETI